MTRGCGPASSYCALAGGLYHDSGTSVCMLASSVCLYEVGCVKEDVSLRLMCVCEGGCVPQIDVYVKEDVSLRLI